MSEDGKFDNGLSKRERERLDLLAEELCQAGHIIGKIGRHGYESRNPDEDDEEQGPTNRRLLEDELGHVAFAVNMLTANGDLGNDAIRAAHNSKSFSIEPWLHHKHEFPRVFGGKATAEATIASETIEAIVKTAARAAVKEFLDGPLTTATDADARKDPA